MNQSGHRARLAKARIRGVWYYISEYQLLPEQSILVEFEGQKLLVSKGDWYELDPNSSQAAEAWGRIHLAEADKHAPTCFCPACQRLRRTLRWNHYSVRDRIEFVMLGAFLMAAVAVCAWGLCAVLSLD